jgi:hypothetical protein
VHATSINIKHEEGRNEGGMNEMRAESNASPSINYE